MNSDANFRDGTLERDIVQLRRKTRTNQQDDAGEDEGDQRGTQADPQT